MCAAVFTYGTLEIGEVLQAVTGHVFPAQRATLRGYARYLMKGKVFPGIVEDAGAETTGTLYLDVDEKALARLDEFEDDFYERRLVGLVTELGEEVQAWAYVVPEGARHLVSDQPWDVQEFSLRHLAKWLPGRQSGAKE